MEDSAQVRAPRTGASSKTLWFAIAAVALAGATLVIALVIPILGTSAPRTIMAQSSRGGPWTIGAACTHYPGAEITLAVPSAGMIVVSATVGIGVNHSFGVDDTAIVVVAASSTDCAVTNHTAFVSVPANLGTNNRYYDTVPILRSFSVSAGTHTFYVNAVMVEGAGPNDRFDNASLVATFYPG